MTLSTTETPAVAPVAAGDASPANADGEAAAAGPRVIGIDLSLTSTGLAAPTGVATIKTEGHDGDTYADRQQRLHHIRNEVLAWCRGADLVVIEGPSYASVGAGTFDRSGLWWMVVDRLITNDIPLAVMTPKSRAKYVSGNGNAKKDQCMIAAVRRFPMFEITGNDIADAVTLMAAGRDHLGAPLVVMPDTHRRALDAVAWPE